jgi:hypothetical protein
MTARTILLSVALALSSVPVGALAQHRLPAGVKWGRCLLVVDGKTRISGRCSYKIAKGGDFHIDGPHQVFEGIDYPASEIMAGKISRDYWAEVFRDRDRWSGDGNSNIGAVHGDPDWGVLRKKGACYVGHSVRVCLWAG